jgi:hypothetical protein
VTIRSAVVLFVAGLVASVGVVRRAGADIVMSAAGLNATLKKMELLKRQVDSGTRPQRAEALYQLGVEGDGLAALINQEVASHGMQERELIDLALARTKELGVGVAYNREKKKFFYDGAGFERYLEDSPNGTHAAAARFKLLSYQFYQSTGQDEATLLEAAEAKKQFLARYPRFKENAELELFLAIDYRDLYRHFRDAHDAAGADKYRLLTRSTYQEIARRHAGTEQASTARQLLHRFDEETQTR